MLKIFHCWDEQSKSLETTNVLLITALSFLPAPSTEQTEEAKT